MLDLEGGTGEGWLGLVQAGWPWLAAAARSAGFMAVAPASLPEFDWRFRVLFGLMIAAAVAPLAGPGPGLESGGSLPVALLLEIASGGLVALPSALFLGAARTSGELIAAAAGMSAAADPDSGEPSTTLGRLYGLLALLVFATLDGPLRLVALLAASFENPSAIVPDLGSGLVERICRLLGWGIEIAVAASAPALLAIAMATVAIGLITRARAAAGMLFAPAIRTLIGLGVVLVLLAATVSGFADVWRIALDPGNR